MRSVAEWLRRLWYLLNRGRFDRALRQEMEAHRSMMSDPARFGNIVRLREDAREVWGWNRLETVLRDLRFAGRLIWRRPAFSFVAIATLALGIGANTAVFAIVSGVLLRPLAFPESHRLLLLSSAPVGPGWSGPLPGLFEDAYLELARRTEAFEHLALFSTHPTVATGAGEPIRVKRASVTAAMFDVLGVTPTHGAGFRGHSVTTASAPAVIISEGFWRSQLGAASDVVGRSLTLDGERHEIAGVMPPGFAFPDEADCWTMVEVRPYQGGNSYIRPVVGRLRPGVTQAHALDELERVTRPAGSTAADWRVVALPLKDRLVGDVRRPLFVLAAAVGFVLLIACVNVANLFLIRVSERTRELTVRAALGAGRLRLVQQLLAESAMIAALAAVGGVLLASLGVPALLALAPAGTIPRVDLVRIDSTVLLFTALLSGATILGFGLLPACRTQVGRGSPGAVSRTTTDRGERLYGVLVVAEIAISLMLLAAAGLMLKGFLSLRAVDTGFNANGVLTATVDLPAVSYGEPGVAQRFHTDALAALARVPGVEVVGSVNWLPFGDMTIDGDFALEGNRTSSSSFNVDKPAVSAGYFRAMGIPLIQGRAFTGGDGPRSLPVAIVSDSAARSLWPGEDAVGKRISLRNPPRAESDWLTVVGVVGDVRQQSLVREGSRAVYQSYLQVARLPFLNRVTFVMRTTADPAAIAPGLRAAVQRADPDLPVPSLVPMQARLATHTASPAFQARVLAIFGAAALGLTIVGIYGVLAFAVSGRTREFGIRMALGAGAGTLVRIVVRRTLALAAGGVAVGSAGALALTRWLGQHLYGVAPADPPTFVAVTLLVMAAALAAAALPAWRAGRVDPTVVLRAE